MKATETVPCIYCPKSVRKGSICRIVPIADSRGSASPLTSPLARLAHPACCAEDGRPKWMRDRERRAS